MHTVSTRRRLLLAGSAAALCGLPAAASAQSFPVRPITLICPWPPGGGADTQMRALAQAASRVFGQQVIIENKAGAVGTLGPVTLLATQPDGYTLSQATNALYRQPFITRTPYDPARDFTFILSITGFNFGLVVRADAPYQSLADLMQAAKAAPGRLNFGTFGIGSPPHTVMDRIAARHGAELTHVPFKGTIDGITALRGGHIDALADGTGWAQFVDGGQFRLLAVFGDGRLRRWPAVPTLKELGYDIAESSPWGIIGPKGMDDGVVRALHDGFRKAMDDPEFLRALDAVAQEPMYMDTESYRKYSLGQIPVQKAIIEKYRLAQR
ncbi:MAG TPA: tripartite tricarboxylate transporter substrate binding protein [Burkholderiaceae bacterium]|nr:tripartite tricarboxylate transporter substrate binding protein [Burkholderiaceae bacterium]